MDAPITRVQAVLARHARLTRLVSNGWVHLIVRDPGSGSFWTPCPGEHKDQVDLATFEHVDLSEEPNISFVPHRTYAQAVAREEAGILRAARLGALISWAAPLALWLGDTVASEGALEMLWSSPGPAVATTFATGATLLSLAFSQRYAHGEHMFARLCGLHVAMLLGFNLVAMAPSLTAALGGWSLAGFASVFLIGMYNERPSARRNAIYAHTTYRLSDLCLLTATGASMVAESGGSIPLPGGLGEVSASTLTAAGLVGAALLKASQFPNLSLFTRCMEGPTPTSALAYSGLSAHLGIVLLALHPELWMDVPWARASVFGVGLVTSVASSLVAQTCSNRKGAIAYNTSAGLGQIFMVLGLGYPGLSLGLALSHGAYRMRECLTAPGAIAEAQHRLTSLGASWRPLTPPEWLYRVAWRFRRLDRDLIELPPKHASAPRGSWSLSRGTQWGLTAGALGLAGLPFTPLTHEFEGAFLQSTSFPRIQCLPAH